MVTDGQTDRRTDGQTDRPTDTKKKFSLQKIFFLESSSKVMSEKNSFGGSHFLGDYNTLSSQLRGPRESKNKAIKYAKVYFKVLAF